MINSSTNHPRPKRPESSGDHVANAHRLRSKRKSYLATIVFAGRLSRRYTPAAQKGTGDMARELPFQEMAMAPRDGTPVQVRHGPTQDIVLANWCEERQAWIATNDPAAKPLHNVRVWRPVQRSF
jgi:hypothetical protein